ncbi:type 2 lactosamine alpha-2,3-sialyltransferase isoform X2 [Elephas maximus indicus]|uniref:type 2 lactosamine alpha-2,3-sialyltransferase isoform X2 n=1 Tax=Elephas maximus indicus TaxID=99487 RepID=UPI00211683A4|nr:type 2 lactosamine alpha-2,3-sialyltransferase isoform X2 [Elephas maximus indicus]
MFQQTDAALEVLTRLCQEIRKTASWSTDWKRSIFMPIPKKGDPTECGNYRTISLISHTSKILLKIIQKRLQQYIDGELPEIQAGFRRGRGTRDIIADVRWILAESREYQKDVYLCFIDYAKAFNCVDHNELWITLRRMGIPEHLIVLMRNLYMDQEAVVGTEQGDTDWFKVRKGVRQGCILSPYLFNLYPEQILREAGLYEEERGIRIGARLINNLCYADDTTLLAESEEDLKHLLMKIKDHSLQYGLHLNIKKTKILTTGPMSNIMINGEKIDVKDFILLGSTINTHGSSSQEIKRRIALGKSAAKDLFKVWKSKDVTLKTKVRLTQAMVFAITPYACESWTMNKEDQRGVDTFELRCWRRILNILWTAKGMNKSVLEECSLEARMAKLRLTYFGHVVRRDQSLEKDIMLGRVGSSEKKKTLNEVD